MSRLNVFLDALFGIFQILLARANAGLRLADRFIDVGRVDAHEQIAPRDLLPIPDIELLDKTDYARGHVDASV